MAAMYNQAEDTNPGLHVQIKAEPKPPTDGKTHMGMMALAPPPHVMDHHRPPQFDTSHPPQPPQSVTSSDTASGKCSVYNA